MICVDPNYSSAACWVKKPTSIEEGKQSIASHVRDCGKLTIFIGDSECLNVI